ncbi:MAG: TetR/AcrR family transcriptional regulator [Acutalibacteraceae bacterium]
MSKPMNKSESKYFNTAVKMDKAFLSLLETKDFSYITVKEICEKAHVNRSTFYLHYESIYDLLDESMEYVNSHFLTYMKSESDGFTELKTDCDLDELIFVTPRYLTPYLQYIRENKRLFRTVIENAAILRLDETYRKLFHHIFEPVMKKFNFTSDESEYILAFYLHGLMAIVTRWLENDCSDSIELIIDIIQKCIAVNAKCQKNPLN